MAGATALALPAAKAQPQSYPDRPIKLVVPFGRAAPPTSWAGCWPPRWVNGWASPWSWKTALVQARWWRARGGQGAASGGYTLFLGASTTLTLNPAIRNPPPYDPLRSFTPLGLVADMGLVLVAKETPARTLPELVALAKARPPQPVLRLLRHGIPGALRRRNAQDRHGHAHGACALQWQLAQPHRADGRPGAGGWDTVVATTPLIKAGKIRPIAALGPSAWPCCPRCPPWPKAATRALPWTPGLPSSPAGLPAPIQKKTGKGAGRRHGRAGHEAKKLVDIGLSPAWGPASALQERIERELAANARRGRQSRHQGGLNAAAFREKKARIDSGGF
ncbi:Serine/threonine-protein phosphatase 6 regulatory subunit 3 [Manis javanica]|nr:Serine/threonine-protein phosphatase 6 regulatory subunit 3 [Manis javanica]